MKVHLSSAIFLIIFLIFNPGCGHHEQDIRRMSDSEESKDSTERDPVKLMFSAARAGDVEKINELATENQVSLESHEPDSGLTVIMVAIQYKQFGVIEYLVKEEVDIEVTSQSEEIRPDLNTLGYLNKLIEDKALNDQDEEIIKAIIAREPFDIEKLNDLQFEALTFFNHQLISWLLEKGADPNILKRNKFTPMIDLMRKPVENSLKKDKKGKIVCSEDLRYVWLSTNFYDQRRIFFQYMANENYDPFFEVGKRKDTVLKRVKGNVKKKKRIEYQLFVDILNCVKAKGEFASCDVETQLLEQEALEENQICSDPSQATIE